jgi:hypothetical protein
MPKPNANREVIYVMLGVEIGVGGKALRATKWPFNSAQGKALEIGELRFKP